MTTIRRITVSQIEGGGADNTDTNEIRPNGETAFYLDNNNKLNLMMFDGTRTHLKSKVLAPGVLWGSNADASDGNNADTIKLIPDATLFDEGSNQYIVVDPTGGEPGHIHLRAGGYQDESTADLYIGAEQTFVRVSDTSENVVIRTSQVSEGIIPFSWTFDNTGALTLPNNGVIRVDGDNIEVGGITNFNVEATGVVGIYTNTEGVTPFQWQFGDDGELIFPDNTVQTTAWAGGRVSTVPGTSLGTTGDKQGDIAFNGSYIYYCTQDFVEASYSSTITLTHSGTFPSIVKGSIPQPQAGWVLIHNGNTYTLDANAFDGNPGEWVLSLSSSISVTIGDSVTVGPASAANIWKRVAWSVDTW